MVPELGYMMSHIKRIGVILLVAGLNGLLLACLAGWAGAASNRVDPPASALAAESPSTLSQVGDDSYLYLPIVSGSPPWPSPFGVEPVSPMLVGHQHYSRTVELDVGWTRLEERISWMVLQPDEGGPIQWDLLETFEAELRTLNAAGIKPLVTVTDSPAWARIDANKPCSAIRADRFSAFSEFMRQLVLRYKEPEFNVHDWELGNEPDVDKDLVDPTSPFGCWGDADDPYYGGRHYGEMLNAVAPVIRAVDAKVRIWNGGLLLDRPYTSGVNCSQPGYCRPELFLEGILLSGAASSIDVLAYHTYPYFDKDYPGLDQDNGINTKAWYPWGGVFVGKANFLRQTMQAYGVDKPLVINESSLICKYGCVPDTAFFQRQADFLARSYVRALANNISGMIWYTLEGPGWYNSGLLNAGWPKPAYLAYKNLTERLRYSRLIGPVNYGPDFEAYTFEVRPNRVQVVWAKTDQVLQVFVPGEKYLTAYDRDGGILTPTPVGSDFRFSVGFSPIYIVTSP
jgi:hypothetical protein